MSKDLRYGDAALKARENIVSKVKSQLNKNVADSGLRLLKLIEIIPNWETYLTKKQLEVAKKYITCMSAYEVDHQLKLTYGTTQQRLFGNNKTSKGALGRLEDVAKVLEQTGYFERQRKIREKMQQKAKSKNTVPPEIVEKVKELIKIVVTMPDYEKYITKSQAEKICEFLRLRNLKATAKQLGITELSLKKSLLTDKNGALSRLKEAMEQNTINNWDDI